MSLIDKLTKRSPRNARTAKDMMSYLSQRYDLLKLELLEKSSQILSVVLSIRVVVCALVVVIYLSNALVSWLTIALNAGWAYTIVCGIFILVIIIVLYKKDTLFVNPLIRKLSRILFSQEDEGRSEKKGGADE